MKMKRSKKRVSLLLMLFALQVLVVAISPMVGNVKAGNGEASFAKIYVYPSVYTATAIGDTFTVKVNIINVSNLGGFDFKLGYDTTVLDALEVAEGSFLKCFGQTLSVKLEINRTLGSVWVAVILLGGVPAEGDGALAAVSFKCIDTGECIFDLYDTMLVNLEAFAIDHYVTDGYSVNEFVDPPEATTQLSIPSTARVVDYDDGVYVVGTTAGELYVVDETGQYTVTQLSSYINDVRIKNGFIAIATRDQVILLSLPLGSLTPTELWRRMPGGWNVASVDLSSDGSYVAYLAQYHSVGVYDNSGTLVASYSISGSWIAWWLDATDDMEYIAITAEVGPPEADYAGTNTGVELYRFNGVSLEKMWGRILIYGYETTEVRVSEDKRFVAAATSSGTEMNLIDLATSEVLWNYNAFAEQFSCDGDDNLNYVIGGTVTSPYKYFILKNYGNDYELVLEGSMAGAVDDLDSTPDGSAFAFGSDAGEFIWLNRTDGTTFNTILESSVPGRIDAIEIGNQSLLVGGDYFINLYSMVPPPPPPLPCDFNHDGVVDQLDYELIRAAFGRTGPPGWIPEDWNPVDGKVDLRDIYGFVIYAMRHDTTPPVTTINLDGILGACGWYASDVTVTLTATDWILGVYKTEYSFDELNWINYTSPFIITTEGVTIVYYRSIDKATPPNIEPTKSQTIKIDKAAPTITIASPEAKNYTQAETLTFSFKATDSVSGIASITGLLSQDPALLYLDPQMSTATVDETFSVDVRIADVVDLSAWTVRLRWNPAVLNFVTVTEGDFLKSVAPTQFLLWEIYEEEGWMLFYCGLAGLPPPPYGASGSGTLATITFQCIAPGESFLNFTDLNIQTWLMDASGNMVPIEAVNGYFTSVLPPEEHDIAVTSVTVSTTKATAGDPVTVTVIVENQGTRTETFDVTVFYDSNVIATQTQIYLDMGQTETLTFTWNTAGLAMGSYLIRAEASVVAGEVDTIDNTFINGIVIVRIPVYSGQTLDLSTLKLGKYTLTVTAIDNACNKAEESVTFRVATTLSGFVTDEYTKEPIQGVTISILETGETAVTNEYGKYSFIILDTGVYTVEMTVPYGYLTHDDVTKFVEVTKATEVNFTLYQAAWSGATVPRTIGYWKNWDNHYTTKMMETFIAHVKTASGLFSDLTVENVKSYLTMGRHSMEQKGEAQLLASWLNVVSAHLGVDVQVDLSSIQGWEQVITIPDGSILTVDELLNQIDNLYLTDANLTKGQWEIVKDILDALNNGQLFI